MTSEALVPPEALALPDPPTDGITALSYLPNTNAASNKSLLASTSFDGSVRIHDTHDRKLVLQQSMESGPLLSLATPREDLVATGGVDGTIRLLDVGASAYQVVGRHTSDDPKVVGCSCLASLTTTVADENNNNNNNLLLASAGWNGMFNVWDVRQSTPAASLALPGKAFAMDVDPVHPYRAVVATAGRRICVVDVRQGSVVVDENAPQQQSWDAKLALNREASLKFQCRTVRYFPDGNGIALGSTEGRVAVEFLEELGLPAKMKKYAFKCHRQGDTVYPVNCIAFHPLYGTFATGGCDGTVGASLCCLACRSCIEIVLLL